MSDNISKDLPPSYGTLTATPFDQLLSSIKRTISVERNADDANPVEVARMRRFILYCLCIDYRHAVPNTFTTEDSQHFSHLHRTIVYLDAVHDDPDVTLTDRQRVELGSYIWRFVHEPCRALNIPTECAIITILRFVKYQDGYTNYKGCAHGLLHNIGPQRLAEKLWQDMNILIPRLLPSPAAQAAMIKRVNELATTYLSRIEGVEGSITPGTNATIGYTLTSNVVYSLTPRGQAYDKARASAIDTARLTSLLSPSHIAARMLECVPGMEKKRTEVIPLKPVAGSAERRKRRLDCPEAWTFIPSNNLPDLFEDRGAKYHCAM